MSDIENDAEHLKEFFLLIIAVFLSIATAASVIAASSRAQTSVRTCDLDLSANKGASEFRHRIDRAVTRMAGGDAPPTGSVVASPELRSALAAGHRQADAAIRAASAIEAG